MTRLQDIPRKQFFTVPAGYFERLPAQVQSRLEQTDETRRPVTGYLIRYALPVALLAAALYYYPSTSPDAESILASVKTEELIQYLQEAGVSTDDILEDVELTPDEVDALESEIYDLDTDDIEMFEMN